MRWLIVFLVLGCKRPPATNAPLPSTPLRDQHAAAAFVERALAAHHDPGCMDEQTIGHAPAPIYVQVAENVPLPPWVSIRAANCVFSTDWRVVENDLRRWMMSAQTTGLGRVVIENIDTLPEEKAVEFATTAMTGPNRVYAKGVFESSRYDRVRNLSVSSSTP